MLLAPAGLADDALLTIRIAFSGAVNAQFAFCASADVATAIARRVASTSDGARSLLVPLHLPEGRFELRLSFGR